ncbi:MAG: hypothetical protein ACE5JD_17440 [Candidatus Methylomirabilia bacterium]
MLFFGTRYAKMSRRRLTIPGIFREALGKLVVVFAARWAQAVYVFPRATGEEFVRELLAGAKRDDDQAWGEAVWTVSPHSEPITLDESHRLTIPREILDAANLPQEGAMAVISLGDHLAVLTRERWNERQTELCAKASLAAVKNVPGVF